MGAKGKIKKMKLQPVLKYPEDLPEGVCIMSGYHTGNVEKCPVFVSSKTKKKDENENQGQPISESLHGDRD